MKIYHKAEHEDYNELVFEYEAKGENMTQEKIKQKLHENALDIAVAIGVFTRGTSTVEADLSEAKSSAKKLIENIDEYLESMKPDFKKGDIVASTVFGDGSFSFVQLNEDLTNRLASVDGFWYIKRDCAVRDEYLGVFKENTRHATLEEIAEYESALNFHKHGRKPFELKKGDLIRTPSEKNTFILNPENYTKEEFLDYGWEFLKTAEEVNEWLENK